MQKITGTALGKLVRLSTKVKGTGGQALPGLIVEKALPNYLARMLKTVPGGVVIITGTNGKTTTTRLVVELLRSQGKKVLTNSTGSNMTRGIASGVIKHAKITGRLDYDTAVFELDEASIPSFIKQVSPRWVLALNVSRDQLDRYGEVDKIAQLIGLAMQAATDGVVTNANDPQLAKLTKNLKKEVKYFGVNDKIKSYFPTDFELAAVDGPNSTQQVQKHNSLVELLDFKKQEAVLRIDDKIYQADFKLTGQHNFLNAAAAIALVKQLLPNCDDEKLVDKAATVSIAFGRGESYRLSNGAVVELVLVKNPASFRQALASYVHGQQPLMIAINDNVADGRDTSWLWDVDVTSLADKQIQLVSGTRAADMALRLSYESIKVSTIEPNLELALSKFANSAGHKVVFATYTAMLRLHTILSKRSGKKP